jgi:hypothetical protein
MRTPVLQAGPCPACWHLGTVAGRTADLLARALADAPTRQVYLQSAGVCLRDLPLVVRWGRDAEPVRTLLHAGRVHLEIVQWELEEFGRKRNWSVRHEVKGPEQSAWWRAVGQVTGSCARAGRLFGLDLPSA